LSAVKHNWDDRILRSDKLRELCEDILSKNSQQVPPKLAPTKEKGKDKGFVS
jgi:hypothetical protein